MYIEMAYASYVLSLLLFASDTDAFITGKNLSKPCRIYDD